MTKPLMTRINARLPAATSQKLAYLERVTGGSTTQVLLAAIDCYHASTTADAGGAAQILDDLGFIGCGEGPPSLSSDYKEHLTVSLAKKT